MYLFGIVTRTHFGNAFNFSHMNFIRRLLGLVCIVYSYLRLYKL